MAKASSPVAKDAFRWRFLLNALQDLRLDQMATPIGRYFASQQWTGAKGWLVITAGALTMLHVNGRLFFATGTGIATMLLVYWMHEWKPKVNVSELRKFLHGWNQPFVIATGAGAIATLLAYMAISVWADSKSPWIASGAILQSMGTLAVLLLLITQMLNRQERRERTQYNRWVSHLVHEDPLKRLIAVRQLTDAVSCLDDESDRRSGSMKKVSRKEIADYFRLMLLREEDPIVRDAIYDGLQTLDIVHQLKQATAPLIQIAPRELAPAKSRSMRVKTRAKEF
ncbi:hypothetical protein OsccyDRAFT_1171 [Leptolyngbyaceae cyanobacterium JSC-12]|nr:hypothetical protein OsccyDRAFT_1171 [Leptolyngbyaceae cyanobacterium JSC-12]